MLVYKALTPIATLLKPVVLDVNALAPIATLPPPVVLAANAALPTTVLLVKLPDPLPTVTPFIVKL